MEYRFSENTANKDQVYNHLVNCNSLFEPALDTRVDIDSYTDKIMRSAYRFEVWLNNRLIGLVAVYLNDSARKSAYITNVSIEQVHTGKGLAKQLVLLSIEKAIRLNFEQVRLEVSARNDAALRLYGSLGFKITNETTEDTFKLVLELKSEVNDETA